MKKEFLGTVAATINTSEAIAPGSENTDFDDLMRQARAAFQPADMPKSIEMFAIVFSDICRNGLKLDPNIVAVTPSTFADGRIGMLLSPLTIEGKDESDENEEFCAVREFFEELRVYDDSNTVNIRPDTLQLEAPSKLSLFNVLRAYILEQNF